METVKQKRWRNYRCAIGHSNHVDFIIAAVIANAAIESALEYSRFRAKLPV